MSRPEDLVLAANLAFYDAFEQLDLAAMGAIWSDSSPISCVHPGWAPVVGRAQVLASWKGIFKGTKKMRFTLRDVRVLVAGDTAWVLLLEQFEADLDDGKGRGAALATNLFVRESDGWRIVHHHATPRPPVEGDRAVDEDDGPTSLLN